MALLKVVWKCAETTCGAPCVMISGIHQMLMLFADSLDTEIQVNNDCGPYVEQLI